MKLLLLLLFCLWQISNSSAAGNNYGFYTGFNYGKANDTGSGIKRIEGPVYGATLGYRFIHWGFDVGYGKSFMDTGHGQTSDYTLEKGRVDATMVDFALRTFFWRFFTLGVGWNDVKSKEVYYLKNVNGNPATTISVNSKGAYKGLLYQAGLVLPLFRFLDLWLLYENRNWMAEKYNGVNQEKVNLSIQQMTAHLVYYFD